MRRAKIHRKTNETDIRIALTIEGHGRAKVSTGIRFLDHMMELVARHGAFDLELQADGDLDVDQHHTVEDVGIALGEAFTAALGSKTRHPARRLLRDADGRDAGRGGRRFRRTQRGSRRYQGAHAAGGRSANRTGRRFLRRILARREGQRARQDDLRTLEPSQDRGAVQGVCARAAGGVFERQATGTRCCQHEGARCDCHCRLRRGQPDVGGEGATAPRAGMRGDQ